MQKMNILTYQKLEERVVDIVAKLGRRPIVWQEVFFNNVRLPSGTIIQVWTKGWQEMLSKITEKGYPAILSSCWYLDILQTDGDWNKYYECEPEGWWLKFLTYQ